MESFGNGRREALEELNRVFDRIGTNLKTELDLENNVLVSRDEYQALRDKLASLEQEKLAQEHERENRIEGLLQGQASPPNNAHTVEKSSEHQVTIVRVDNLEEVDQHLSQELAQSPQQLQTTENPTATHPEHDADSPVSGATYRSLARKFNTLHKNWTDIKEAQKLLEQISRDRQAKLKAYYTYCDSQEKQVRKLKLAVKSLKAQVAELGGGPNISTDIISPLTSSYLERPSDMPPSCHGNHEAKAGGRVEETQFVDLEPYNTSTPPEEPDSAVLGDITHGVINSDNASVPSSPELPVIISTRKVKGGASSRKDRSSQASKTTIKTEEVFSSSPLGLAALVNSSDSIDLDEIGEKQVTPRKQPLPALLRRTSSMVFVGNGQHRSHKLRQHSGLIAPKTPISKSLSGQNTSALRPLSTNKKIMFQANEERAPKRRRVISDEAVYELTEDGEYVQNENSNENMRHNDLLANLLEKPSPIKSILKATPKSMPRASKENILGSGRRRKSHDLNPLESVQLSSILHEPNIPSRQTLIGMSRSVAAQPSPLVTATKRSIGSTGLISTTPTIAMRPTNKPGSEPARTTINKRRSLKAAEIFNADVDHPDNEPLRGRSVDKLSLDDFKINTKYNKGVNYAFNEVVRKKDERRCLQGCTKPDCCGPQFRTMAETFRNPGHTLTSAEKEEDEALLKDFLGDNAHRLRKMTDMERNETLLQARTREFANKYGRHRAAYERAKSPVGYWDVDFPTTQEEKVDRERMKKAERERVEYRYREAMRPGGAFLFRDE